MPDERGPGARGRGAGNRRGVQGRLGSFGEWGKWVWLVRVGVVIGFVW
jgi:hypothetical protein